MLEILIGMAIGAIIGCALIGLCEILAGANEYFEGYDDIDTVEFFPVKELKKYLKRKPKLKSILDALEDNPNATSSFLLLENGSVEYFDIVEKELKDEVNSRGYRMYRGDDQMYIR